MHDARFDRLSKLFAARRFSRRQALATGSAGLATTSLAAIGLASAAAQEGTPVATPARYPDDPHPGADSAGTHPEFLFVQPFASGAWSPSDAAAGTYTLTLTGAAAHTVYFSDRPERIVGLAPTQTFLDGLGFTPENPPNAALVAQTESGEQDILVIELLNPAYDADAGTLTYDARVLADYGEPGLASLARQQTDYAYPETFGDGSLFIDDCPDGTVTCMNHFTGQVVGSFGIGYCWTSGLCCQVCCSDCDYELQCTQQFGDACNNGEEGYYCSAEYYPLPPLHC